MSRTTLLPGMAAIVAAALIVVTLPRVPTPIADSELYASIARAEQLIGSGVPSVLGSQSRSAVDHTAFYGPVFFTLAATSFELFGFSLRSYRLVSLLGALLIVASGAWLAHTLSGDRDRWVWAVALLLLTPELRMYSTIGMMDTLAVGWETMALAVFVAGIKTIRGRTWFAVGAGLLLSLAALTTPRTGPFLVAFGVAGLLLPSTRRIAAVSLAVLAVVFCAWTVQSYGSPVQWARQMTFVLTHDTNAAVAADATRNWLFSWSMGVTPLAAAVGAVIVAVALTRRRDDVIALVLLTSAMAFALGAVTMNLTFTLGTYIALPLFLVLLAVPYESLGMPRFVIAVAAAVIVTVQIALAGVWYARVAATWEARNPDRLEDFFRAHVPAGSVVVGPDTPYLMAVEGTGSRYRTVDAESRADWARLPAPFGTDAPGRARIVPAMRTSSRYVVWHADEDLPDGYQCASAHQVAVYDPPPTHLNVLGWLGARTVDTGYPRTFLFELPPGCPAGYDPTAS